MSAPCCKNIAARREISEQATPSVGQVRRIQPKARTPYGPEDGPLLVYELQDRYRVLPPPTVDRIDNRWPLLVDPFEDENGINGTIHKENPFPIFGLIDVPGPALATGSLPWGTTKIFTFGFSS
jgi:hypothetical protein